MSVKIIKFTDAEVACLLHRFGVHDAIAEVLSTEYKLNPEYIEARALAMAKELTEHNQLVIISDIDRSILIDAIDGSTIRNAGTVSEYTIQSIEKKVREAGIEISGFP